MPLMINSIGFGLPNYRINQTTHTKTFKPLNTLNNDVFVKNTSNKQVSFGGKLRPLIKLLPEYNTGTAIKNGEFFYKPEHLLDIIKTAKEAGVTSAYRVLGNGVESVAFEVPSTSRGTEVLKISKSPVPDYILNIFNEGSCNPYDKIKNDELARYIVPMRRYKEHKINGNIWFSYFQDKLLSKCFLGEQERDVLSLNTCKRFSSQLKRETAYCVFEGENFPAQYGIQRYPNGQEEIRILDYGILRSKLEDEADEYYDIKDALADAEKAKKLRIKKQLPDMCILQENLASVK